MDESTTTTTEPIRSRRTRRVIATVGLFAFGLGLTVVACGDDDASSADTPASSARLSEADYLAQGNAICAETNAAIGQRIGELFADGEPSAEDEQETLDFLLGRSEAGRAALGALAEPPSMSDDVEALLAALDDANADAASQTGAEFFATPIDPWAEFANIAIDLGLDACAEGGE